MPITKSDLIEDLSERLKLPKGKAEFVVNTIFDSMEEALRQGERIEIRGFGSFEVREYKAYEGRNPRTGDPVHVQPKRLPFFKVGKELKDRVNTCYRQQLKEQERAEAEAEPTSSQGHSPDGATGAGTPW